MPLGGKEKKRGGKKSRKENVLLQHDLRGYSLKTGHQLKWLGFAAEVLLKVHPRI